MGQIQDIQLFNGGMDQDSPDETIQKGDYRKLINGRNRYGKVVSLKGNTDISGEAYNPDISGGVYTTMVTGVDLENKALIEFKYNTTAALCCIHRVYNENSFIEVIHVGSIFNFSLSYPIYDVEIIDGYLFWTEDLNPPRTLNMNKAIDLNGKTYAGGDSYINGVVVQYGGSVWKCISATSISGVTPTEGSQWTELRTTDAYDSIDEQAMSVIKYSPAFEVETLYFTDSNLDTNLIKGKVLQFAYRYVYDDNGKSTISPYSKIVIPEDEIFLNNESNVDVKNNNGLRLFFNVGHQLVKKVELFVREGNIGDWFLYDTIEKYDSGGDYLVIDTFSGTLTQYNSTIVSISDDDLLLLRIGMYIYDDASLFIGGTVYIISIDTGTNSIVVSSGANVTGTNSLDIITYPGSWIAYEFYNNISFIAQDQNDLARPFDYVPRKAKFLEVIEDTKLSYANYTQGFDNVDVDVSLTRLNIPIDTIPSMQDTTLMTIAYNSGYPPTTHLVYNLTYADTISANSYLTIIIKILKVNSEGDIEVNRYYPFAVLLNTADVVSETTIYAKIKEVLERNDACGTTTVSFPQYDFLVDTDSVWGAECSILVASTIYNPISGDASETITNSNITIDIYIDSYMPTYKTWKDGDISFGIEYADEAGRFGNVNTNDNCVISVPTIPSRKSAYDESPTDPNENSSSPYSYVKILWEISHRPPTFAYYWRWVVYDSVSTFNQFKFRTYRVDGGKVRIWFNEYIKEWNNNNGDRISEYQFVKGDRFRILSFQAANVWYTVPKVIEGEIVGAENNDDGNYEIIVENISKIVDIDAVASYMVGEVFTPSKTISEKVYKEMGKTFEIGNPGTSNAYHISDTTIDTFVDQSANLVTDAQGYFLSGNAYTGYRNDMHLPFPCIRQDLSDQYDSEVYDFGRSNSVDKNAVEQVFNTRINFGGNYINDTALNFVGKFEFDDYVELNEKYGSINGIMDEGQTLKVFQRSKETSIYVNATEMRQPDGSTILIRSDDVLSTVRKMADDYGCQHPRGIVRHNRNIYYPDLDEGVVIRTSPNGQIPISKYKFESFFKEKFYAMKTSTNTIGVFAAFLDEFNEYILCLVDGDDVECMVFHEESNRWTHHLLMVMDDAVTKIEHLASIGQTLYSFMAGTVWRHESNSTYNYLFGEQRNTSVEYIVNTEALRNKLFMNISIHTDNNRLNKSDDTTNWDITSIEIPSSKMYPSGQSSRIKPRRMKFKEGVAHAAFLRDLNTPGKSNKDALINGRLLIGKTMGITMEHESDEEVNLFSVVVECNFSEKNSP